MQGCLVDFPGAPRWDKIVDHGKQTDLPYTNLNGVKWARTICSGLSDFISIADLNWRQADALLDLAHVMKRNEVAHAKFAKSKGRKEKR